MDTLRAHRLPDGQIPFSFENFIALERLSLSLWTFDDRPKKRTRFSNDETATRTRVERDFDTAFIITVRRLFFFFYFVTKFTRSLANSTGKLTRCSEFEADNAGRMQRYEQQFLTVSHFCYANVQR